MNTNQKAYASAGVDIALAERLLDEVKPALKKAVRPESLGSIGGFGGFFDISRLRAKRPVLVSSTDSIGTKVKVASMTGIYSGLGADIVNHCSNDIAVCGGEPLFFLDYYATGKLEARSYVSLLKGLARACEAGNVALAGGETAELPGVYAEGEFDLVGTIVGVVDRSKILTGEAVRKGDMVVGLASSGLHTNGYSLARKLFFHELGLGVNDKLPGSRRSVGKALLEPHTNYAPFLVSALERFNKGSIASRRKENVIYGLAHITGGGFTGNIPRILPDNVDVQLRTNAWKRPAVFEALAATGKVSYEELHEVFNMGIGLVMIVRADAADAVIAAAAAAGHRGYVIGEVTAGSRKVSLHPTS